MIKPFKKFNLSQCTKTEKVSLKRLDFLNGYHFLTVKLVSNGNYSVRALSNDANHLVISDIEDVVLLVHSFLLCGTHLSFFLLLLHPHSSLPDHCTCYNSTHTRIYITPSTQHCTALVVPRRSTELVCLQPTTQITPASRRSLFQLPLLKHTASKR